MRLPDQVGGGGDDGDPGAVHGYVGEREVPASVLDLSPLPGFDYVDLFTRATEVAATPEEWARAKVRTPQIRAPRAAASSRSRATISPAGRSSAARNPCPAHSAIPPGSPAAAAAARSGRVMWWTSG